MNRYMIGVAQLSEDQQAKLRAVLESNDRIQLIEPVRPIGSIWLAEMDDHVADELRSSDPGLIVEIDARLQ